MQTYSNQGVVKEDVTLVFENGYTLTFSAGVEISLSVVAESPLTTGVIDVAHTHDDVTYYYRHCPACNSPG